MTDTRLMQLVQQAFDYRGYVTVVRHDGSSLVGFVYQQDVAEIAMFDEDATQRVTVPLRDIADISITGDDSAARAQRRWERRRDSLEARETSAWGEWEQRPTLILVALPIELRGIASVLRSKVRGTSASAMLGEHRVIARAVGVGGGAAHVVAADRPSLVINCGFAGALEKSLGAGDLVLASSVRDESGESVMARESVLRIARRALAYTQVAEGELLCATRIAATREDKRILARPGRLAVDLESWASARAAERAGIPWLALRVVLDPLEIDLPRFASEAREHYVPSVVRHTLRGPRAVLDLARLGTRTAIAFRSLRRAMQQLMPVLGELGACEVHS
ncbi:MAG TPA: hypothetical protein VFV99_32100 [Kofleriaceae bacterium]|nr:hypothetical protein [Kofleriaceae bacterium]